MGRRISGGNDRSAGASILEVMLLSVYCPVISVIVLTASVPNCCYRLL